MPFYSPLRYPGGKRKLAKFIRLIILRNSLDGATYVEPFAGGAAVALELLIDRRVRKVWINDVDPVIYAFWRVIKSSPEDLCKRIRDARMSVSEWDRQRSVQVAHKPDILDLAFSTLYLNRTCRSGVLGGGLLGGRQQDGEWRMDARFNKSELIRRIERIALQGDRLRVTGMDAEALLRKLSKDRREIFVYADPPYVHKADRLYRHDYAFEDHVRISELLTTLDHPWLVTYDECAEVRQLYRGQKSRRYSLSYTAGTKRRGAEVLFSPHVLRWPRVSNPARIQPLELRRLVKVRSVIA